jgi:hypothetical protein
MLLLLLGFSVLLTLMLLLVLLAAIGLGPGGSGSLGPVPTPPRFEAGVGDGMKAGHPADLAVGGAQVAPIGPGVGAARTALNVADTGGAPEPAPAPGPALAPARAVQVAAAAPVSTPSPAPEPAQASPVAAAPVPVDSPPSASPSPVPAGTGTPAGPIAAGVIPPAPDEPTEACEGVEYTVTVAFDVEAVFGGATDAEIVLRRVGSDGSEVELQIEGGLEDLELLLHEFASEGECVTVEVVPLPGEDGVEAEAPEAEPAVTP